MKTSKSLAVILITTAGLGLVLAGCGKSSNKGSNPTSKTSMQNPTKDKTAKEALTSNDNLWYMNGSINYKSKTGIDAYKFDDDHNTVTIYSVGKMYKTYDDAKKANDLDKQGTLKYSFKNDSAENPIIYMKGKLSDIPMDQTISVKGKVSGKYHASDLKVSGFKVVRNLDNDDAKQVLVTPGN